jgi:hypothetical protein
MPIDPLLTVRRTPPDHAFGATARLLSPPQEAIDEVQRAAARWEELAAADRHVSFTVASGGLRIELQDATGRALRRLRPSEALDIAAGAPPS